MLTAEEAIVPIIIEIICGAAGAVFLCWLVPRFSYGPAGNVAIGAAGGLAFTWLSASIPGLGRLVGRIETVADATAQSVGALSPAILIGVGIAGLIGGILLAAIAGLIRPKRVTK